MNRTIALVWPARSARALAVDFFALTKPGIVLMALATTLTGLFLAIQGGMDWGLALRALAGTGLAAAGCHALNMVFEWRADARMERTHHRPIPSGRVSPEAGFAFGLAVGLAGIGFLLVAVNPLTALLGAVCQLLYLGAYTPLKHRTPLHTVVGAVPGALPALMGWSAARGTLDAGAWCLGAILFLWQLPHFLAIAWRFRADYARGGFVVLPHLDPKGIWTGRLAVVLSTALVLASLLPVLVGIAARPYFFGALALGAGFLAVGLLFAARRTDEGARRLFLASIVYLPLLLSLLAANKIAPDL